MLIPCDFWDWKSNWALKRAYGLYINRATHMPCFKRCLVQNVSTRRTPGEPESLSHKQHEPAPAQKALVKHPPPTSRTRSTRAYAYLAFSWCAALSITAYKTTDCLGNGKDLSRVTSGVVTRMRVGHLKLTTNIGQLPFILEQGMAVSMTISCCLVER